MSLGLCVFISELTHILENGFSRDDAPLVLACIFIIALPRASDWGVVPTFPPLPK